VQFILIVISRGEWIAQKTNWIILGLTGFLVAIFRLNGIMVVIVPLLLLPILFRSHWKKLIGSLLLTCILFGLVKGPLYSFMKVSYRTAGQSNVLLLHHIAAHVDAGTPMTDEESAYLNTFMPLEDWDYWCCYVAPLLTDKDFDRGSFVTNSSKNRKLFLDLFLRDPWVSISHTFCSGELVWKFTNNQCYTKSANTIIQWKEKTEDWIVINDIGINEASIIPKMIQPYFQWLRSFGFATGMIVWYLKPGFYLYLAIFSLGVAFIRLRDWKVWLAGLPVYVHTLVIYLISYAPAFRYHYNTLFAGLFFMVFLFIQPPEGQTG
jgi:hypothetical protein